MICITSYDRPDMLLRLLKELQGCGHEIHVFDDCSDYPYTDYLGLCQYHRAPVHRGKEEYWRQWQWILDTCKHSDADRFLFMPDDWHSVELWRVHDFLDALEPPFAFNFTNNGVVTNWTGVPRREKTVAGEEVWQVGFVDCGFFCPLKTLRALDWKIRPVPQSRFTRDNISSGVGQQLSTRLFKLGIPIYQPRRSMAWHDGTHESKMHPQERKENPLIPR